MRKSTFVLFGLFLYQLTALGMESEMFTSSGSSRNLKAIKGSDEFFSGPTPETIKNLSREFHAPRREDPMELGIPIPRASRNSSREFETFVYPESPEKLRIVKQSGKLFLEPIPGAYNSSSKEFGDDPTFIENKEPSPTPGNIMSWDEPETSSDPEDSQEEPESINLDAARNWLNQKSSSTGSMLASILGRNKIKEAFQKVTDQTLLRENCKKISDERMMLRRRCGELSNQLTIGDVALRESANQLVNYMGPHFSELFNKAGSSSERVKLITAAALQCVQSNTENITRMQEEIESMKERISSLEEENKRLKGEGTNRLENKPMENHLLEHHQESVEEEKVEEGPMIGNFDINGFFSYEGELSEDGACGKGVVSHKNGIITIKGTFCKNTLNLAQKLHVKGGSYRSECTFEGTDDERVKISLSDIVGIKKVAFRNSCICAWLPEKEGKSYGIAFNPDFIYMGPLGSYGEMSKDGIKVLAGKNRSKYKGLLMK